jgi:hypothetical protein
MAKLKLRKGVKIGALSAEHDEILSTVFVDLGHVESLTDGQNPCFLILGRTGSGKSALISQIKRTTDHVSQLDPEELSMQYLHNSSVLKTISTWNVNLDVFYKYLWRHVIILELIRMRYVTPGDVPTSIREIFNLTEILLPSRKEAKKLSVEYLKEYGGEYWIKSETHVKKITEKLTSRLVEDSGIAAKLGLPGTNVALTMSEKAATGSDTHIESAVVQRAQSIVSDYLIAGLNNVVEMLEKYGFSDTKKHYCLVIDDLDTDWMPDDEIYLTLIKSLLHTVLELNKKLKSVKIIIALREDIYHRLFSTVRLHEPQREKWADVSVQLQWERAALIELVDKRLEEVFRHEYTQAPPTLRDVLPPITKKSKVDPIDYVLERTFMRPRDLIEFINLYLKYSQSEGQPIWKNLWKAEIDYSELRIQSVLDEWKDNYYGIHVLFPFLKRVGSKFAFHNFTDFDVNEVMSAKVAEDSRWLQGLVSAYMNNKIGLDEVKIEMLKSLYIAGIIGVRLPHSHELAYSFQNPIGIGREILSQAPLYVHKMFWSSLGFTVRDQSADS